LTGPKGGEHEVHGYLTAQQLREAAEMFLEAADDMEKQQDAK